MSVTLTDNAVKKIKELYTHEKNAEGKALRVAIESGGCSGYSYAFKFEEASENDLKQEYEGFNVIIDKESDKLLNGATIDYKEDFGAEGFAIKNPNSKSSCGCGNSFEA